MTKRKNHSPDFKAKVALEAIREEMTMAELSKKYDIDLSPSFGLLKSHRQAQRFLSAHDQISLIFRPRRYQIIAT